MNTLINIAIQSIRKGKIITVKDINSTKNKVPDIIAVMNDDAMSEDSVSYFFM